MRAVRSAIRVGAALVVLGALASCTAAPPAATEAPTPALTTTAEPGPQPIVLDAGVTVATGTLASADGLTSGSAGVVSRGDGGFDLVIDGFSSPVTSLVVNLTSDPFDEQTYCEVSQVIWVLGTPTAAPRMVLPIGLGSDPTADDPSYLDTVLLTVNDADAPKTGCFYPVFASTELVWTMPDLRPDLVVTDSGSTGGATGLVDVRDGVPVGYTVAPGDVMAEIAARLGITVSDLEFLDPVRMKGPTAQTGEVLNLDKDAR